MHSPAFLGALPRRWLRLWLLALLFAAAGPAAAQNCWSSGSANISFGSAGNGIAVDTSDTVNLTCQADASPRYLRWCLFIGGEAPIAGVNPRYMTNYNGGQMAYDLYSDAARTQIIGPPPTGAGYTVYTGTAVVPGNYAQSAISVPVYGRVAAGQDLPAGNYQAGISNAMFYVAMATSSYPASCTTGAWTGSVGPMYIGVSATVANACRISLATDLDFGAVSTLASNRDQTSQISVRCKAGTTWTLGLSNGVHASGTTRRMRSAAGQYVTYEMYRDTGRSQRWGNASGSWATGTGAGDANPTALTVYGRVAAQAATSGTYSDTVTVTLTY